MWASHSLVAMILGMFEHQSGDNHSLRGFAPTTQFQACTLGIYPRSILTDQRESIEAYKEEEARLWAYFRGGNWQELQIDAPRGFLHAEDIPTKGPHVLLSTCADLPGFPLHPKDKAGIPPPAPKDPKVWIQP